MSSAVFFVILLGMSAFGLVVSIAIKLHIDRIETPDIEADKDEIAYWARVRALGTPNADRIGRHRHSD